MRSRFRNEKRQLQPGKPHRSGGFWFGGDLGLVHDSGGKRVAYSKGDGLADNVVTAVCEDRQGNVWVGTSSGLNRFVAGKFYAEFKLDGTPWDPINTIFEDRDRTIWVGTIDGLCRLTKKRFTVYSKRAGLSYSDVIFAEANASRETT